MLGFVPPTGLGVDASFIEFGFARALVLSARSLVFLLVAGCFSAAATAAQRPNIVWILSEDNSKHYLKHFAPAGAAAPNIEAMASQGVTFDRACSCSPVCSVARTTRITSCYASGAFWIGQPLGS